MTKFSRFRSLPITNLSAISWPDRYQRKPVSLPASVALITSLCHSSLSVMLVHRDAEMTTVAVEKKFNTLFLYISISALLCISLLSKFSSPRYAGEETMLLDQKHGSKLCQETDSFEHACWKVYFMRPGCRNWHSTLAWENCLTWDLLVQDAIYSLWNSGIKILSLSPHYFSLCKKQWKHDLWHFQSVRNSARTLKCDPALLTTNVVVDLLQMSFCFTG